MEGTFRKGVNLAKRPTRPLGRRPAPVATLPEKDGERIPDFVAPKVAAEIKAWLSHLGAERRLSPKTLEAYRRDVLQFLQFLAEHLGGAPSLNELAALAPAEGETVADVFYRAQPHPEAPELEPDAHGFIWMPAGGFARAVAHKASADQTTILEAVQRPIAVKCIQEKAPAPAWTSKPSWFLLAEEDRMIAPETQRYMAERMGAKIRPHQVDHTPMQTAPDVVVA